MEKSNHSSEPDFKFSISDRLKEAEEQIGDSNPSEDNPESEGSPSPEDNLKSEDSPTPEKPTLLETQNNTVHKVVKEDIENFSNTTENEEDIIGQNIKNTVARLRHPDFNKKESSQDDKSEEEDEDINVEIVNTFTVSKAQLGEEAENNDETQEEPEDKVDSEEPEEVIEETAKTQSQIITDPGLVEKGEEEEESSQEDDLPIDEGGQTVPLTEEALAEPTNTFNTVIGKRSEFDSREAFGNPSDILDNAVAETGKKDVKKASGNFSRDLEKRYELMGSVGQGGMGVIRSVEDKNLNRTLAMKILSPKYVEDRSIVEAFLEEASITAQLQHPNIIPVHDIGILPESGNHFYTMKLVDGKSLQEVIDELKAGNEEYKKKYNFNSILSIFRKVCDAVAYAHSKGIIHRDIKPGNIMVGPFGEVLLLDWGLAKYSGEEEEIDIKKRLSETNHDAPLMTMDGIIKGSLAYLSPEQANGEIKEIDHQTDIFLLGATLYHMLTLEPPYTSKNMVEIIRKAETASFTHPNDTEFGKRIPEALVNILMKSMAELKEDRFKTVEELIKKLDDYIEGRNVSQLRTFPKGSMLIEDKEFGDETFIIISGKVEISRIIDGKETLIETLERGAVFGELAALTHDIRTAQVKAIEDTQVMIISKQLMFDEIRKMPPWLEKIVFNLALKVSSMNDRIHPFILSNCSLPVLKQLLYLYSIVNSNSENEKTVAIDYEGILYEISQNLGISTKRIEEVLQVLEEFKMAEKDGSNRFCITSVTDLKYLIAYIKREQNITEGMSYSLDEISISKIPMLDEVYQRMATLQY